MRIHHVQLTYPPTGHDAAVAFYTKVVGLTRVDQPDMVAARGGFWAASSDGGIELHFGTEEPFRPQAKGHPALMVDDVDALAARLEAAGHAVTWAPQGEVPGLRRFHTFDPAGNRLEFLSAE